MSGFLVAVCNQNMISSGNAMTSPSYNIKVSAHHYELYRHCSVQ